MHEEGAASNNENTCSDQIDLIGVADASNQIRQPDKKKRKIRKAGDEEQIEINKLDSEIRRIESEIDSDAIKHAECRRILSLGVGSIAIIEELEKIDGLLVHLKDLKSQRQSVLDKKDEHLIAVSIGNDRAMVIEEVRNERAIKFKYHPMSSNSRTEENEIVHRMDVKLRSKPRANSINCPTGCSNLVADEKGCSLLCPTCGFVYEDIRCNPDNPVCSMGKFGEKVDVPRRRSGGYKPPNHFAEIIGYFQGTRSSTAPPEVLERVSEFCARYKYEPKDITQQVVRFFLRRMQQDENNRHDNALPKNPKDCLKRYTDFYRSAPEMAYRLSGKPPPYMSPMQEDRILAVFPLVIAAYKTSPRYLRRLHLRNECMKMGPKYKRCQIKDRCRTNPKYMKHLQSNMDCIKDFPNNPNYFLVFYKLCQLFGYDEFLPYIPLPKSTDNIDDNDTESWVHICAVNGWQYIPTR
jgi:hypothetical protein